MLDFNDFFFHFRGKKKYGFVQIKTYPVSVIDFRIKHSFRNEKITLIFLGVTSKFES